MEELEAAVLEENELENGELSKLKAIYPLLA